MQGVTLSLALASSQLLPDLCLPDFLLGTVRYGTAVPGTVFPYQKTVPPYRTMFLGRFWVVLGTGTAVPSTGTVVRLADFCKIWYGGTVCAVPSTGGFRTWYD